VTQEDRIEKCLRYCRFLRKHGAIWETDNSRQTGMVSSDWVLCCLTGEFDHLPDTPYLEYGCSCESCTSELRRAELVN
jgi:hypothetical protein